MDVIVVGQILMIELVEGVAGLRDLEGHWWVTRIDDPEVGEVGNIYVAALRTGRVVAATLREGHCVFAEWAGGT